jgi:DNA-3-methyladenine glycosylase
MGRTPRNRRMWGPAGIAYVYFVYGMYHCLNVVTEEVGVAAAVLVRAVEPGEGIDLMRAARQRRLTQRLGARTAARPGAGPGTRQRSIPDARLAAGPGLVAVAFDITRADTGVDLCDPGSPLRLEPGDAPPTLATTPRIGIDYAPEPWLSHPWRVIVPDSPSLSRRR